MLNKTFLITELGTPLAWTQQYIDACAKLEHLGWNWKIFTPNKYDTPKNVEIVPMTATELRHLTFSKLGMLPNLHITQFGTPSIHVSDLYVYSGVLFEDYIKGVDFWGVTNLDVVYGRLDRFVSDAMLEDTDIFTDDVNTINGVFSLWRNNAEMNNLFRHPDFGKKFGYTWMDSITGPVCQKCCFRTALQHTFFVTDEYAMTEVVRELAKQGLRFRFPAYYPMLGHDRLEQHRPEPKLKWEVDGSLWELFEDVGGPEWAHARPYIGREIPYFHFPNTKKWPAIQSEARNLQLSR